MSFSLFNPDFQCNGVDVQCRCYEINHRLIISCLCCFNLVCVVFSGWQEKEFR